MIHQLINAVIAGALFGLIGIFPAGTDYIPLDVSAVKSDGTAIDPVGAVVNVYYTEADGSKWPIGGSPFTLVKQVSKTGYFGYALYSDALTAGTYSVMVTASVDSKSTLLNDIFIVSAELAKLDQNISYCAPVTSYTYARALKLDYLDKAISAVNLAYNELILLQSEQVVLSSSSGPWRIKKGDRKPELQVQLINAANNAAIDLSAASGVKFYMKNRSTGTLTVNGAAATVTDAANGKVKYSWDADDTTTAGDYLCEFKVDWGSSLYQTVPVLTNLVIQIVEDLAS